jgi:Lrp/AsnC family leucine-responsive transcriptional regulator
MPFQLDEHDVSIIKSLLDDGRKSFRQISRETGITTPTVKARYERLVRVGFIRSVTPVFDFEKVVDPASRRKIAGIQRRVSRYAAGGKQPLIKKGMAVMLECDFCHGDISGRPHVFKFADQERFFCCSACRAGYREKYGGRIDAIRQKHARQSAIGKI